MPLIHRQAIYVTASFTGMHCWPLAPDPVKFLRSLHRHVFGVKVTVHVTHNDRQVEFFNLKADVEHLVAAELQPELKREPAMSCEHMAEFIAGRLSSLHYNVHSVEVNEDGENGAILTLTQEI